MTSGNQQSSTDKTYIDSIQFLEDARTALSSIKGQVNDERMVLAGGYAGEDGTAFQRKLDDWLNEIEKIRGTCMKMENTLNENRQSSNRATQHNVTSVLNVNGGGDTSTSQSTFTTLTTPS
ncbi:hypothetical protein [Streptomyces sp. NPDC003247]|uniref:hypothetical protein n=1 Tax=Streptomyces sp. NPDC003247 TaxID=3364677 RepID=UPI0036A6B403